jgi:hypothetical protein
VLARGDDPPEPPAWRPGRDGTLGRPDLLVGWLRRTAGYVGRLVRRSLVRGLGLRRDMRLFVYMGLLGCRM